MLEHGWTVATAGYKQAQWIGLHIRSCLCARPVCVQSAPLVTADQWHTPLLQGPLMDNLPIHSPRWLPPIVPFTNFSLTLTVLASWR